MTTFVVSFLIFVLFYTTAFTTELDFTDLPGVMRQIEAMRAKLAEVQSKMGDQAATIQEQGATIQDRNETIQENDTTIAQQAAIIEEKNTTIQEQHVTMDTTEKYLFDQYAEALDEKEAELDAKEAQNVELELVQLRLTAKKNALELEKSKLKEELDKLYEDIGGCLDGYARSSEQNTTDMDAWGCLYITDVRNRQRAAKRSHRSNLRMIKIEDEKDKNGTKGQRKPDLKAMGKSYLDWLDLVLSGRHDPTKIQAAVDLIFKELGANNLETYGVALFKGAQKFIREFFMQDWLYQKCIDMTPGGGINLKSLDQLRRQVEQLETGEVSV